MPRQTDGRKDGQTIFHRTLLATAGGPKRGPWLKFGFLGDWIGKYSHCQEPCQHALNAFLPIVPFDPPETNFWCFQGDQKGTLGRKGLTRLTIFEGFSSQTDVMLYAIGTIGTILKWWKTPMEECYI